MAQDYTGIRSFPTFKEFTPASGKWTQIDLPSNCSQVQIGSTGALYVSHTGTDDTAVQASDEKGFIVASNYLTFKIGRGSTRDSQIFVAAQSGTPKITVLLEE